MHKPIKFIYVVLIIVLIGGGITIGLLSYQDGLEDGKNTTEVPYSDSKIVVVRKDEQGRPIEQLRIDDTNCSLGKPPDIELSLEYIIYENIKQDLPVTIITSCDRGTFTVTGSVTQVVKYMHENSWFNLENVSVNRDFNFDGYNDLDIARIFSGGGGDDYNTKYISDIYLYDSVSKKFVHNIELSNLKNVILDPSKKYVQEDLSYYTESGEHIDNMYKTYIWVDGHLKVKN